jgi:isopentenyl diphosphate isomerase/L-lactate dehydrogenase-like FMN-dependent dehydrogenase
MKTYIDKQVPFQAIEYRGNGIDEYRKFCPDVEMYGSDKHGPFLVVPATIGLMVCQPGDYITRTMSKEGKGFYGVRSAKGSDNWEAVKPKPVRQHYGADHDDDNERPE